MKKTIIFSMTLLLVFSSCSLIQGQEAKAADNAGDLSEVSGIEEDLDTSIFDEADENSDFELIEISSKEELMAVGEKLDGYYTLTKDIDLEGEEWTPIGTFVPLEDGSPDPLQCFTGMFDGGGHTISNFVINRKDDSCNGLFGCICDGSVTSLNLKDVTLHGGSMTGGLAGFCIDTYLYQVTGKNITIVGEKEGEGMYGGLVGASNDCFLDECSVRASIQIPDNSKEAGLLGGRMNATSFNSCKAYGDLTAGDHCYGLGGLTGSGLGAEEYNYCIAKKVSIKAGAGSKLVGGIAGYAGGYEEEALEIPVTEFNGCETSKVTFDLGEGSEEPGRIVGGGYLDEEMAAKGAPYDAPTLYKIED